MRPFPAPPAHPGHPAHPRNPGEERTSGWLIPLWFLLAVPLVPFSFFTFTVGIFSAPLFENSVLPAWFGTAGIGAMLLTALLAVPVGLAHLVLVCLRRRGTARRVLLVVLWACVVVFFASGWGLVWIGGEYGGMT
ncbi:hypothetical protein [Nocardiopsis alba]|uniref:hypothetical protein n=1 Tax=Nocardiopsis alba TaxID=53437 RepID=UPI003D74B4E7